MHTAAFRAWVWHPLFARKYRNSSSQSIYLKSKYYIIVSSESVCSSHQATASDTRSVSMLPHKPTASCRHRVNFSFVTYCENPVSTVRVVIKESSSKLCCRSFHPLLPSLKLQSLWTLQKKKTPQCTHIKLIARNQLGTRCHMVRGDARQAG